MWRIKFALLNLSLNTKRFIGGVAKHFAAAVLVMAMISVVLALPSVAHFAQDDPDNNPGIRRGHHILPILRLSLRQTNDYIK